MAKAAKQGFQIPTKEEVIKFIDEVMTSWPSSYCVIIGERFWQTYQSVGWRISKNIMMKDWHATWHGRWKHNLNDRDKKLLEEHLRMPAHRIALDRRRQETAGLFAEQEAVGAVRPLDRTLDFLDEIMVSCLSGGASDSQLRTACDWLRGNNLLRLPQEQIDRIKIQAGNDGDFSKLLAIKQFFANLKGKDLTVKSYVHSKMQKV